MGDGGSRSFLKNIAATAVFLGGGIARAELL